MNRFYCAAADADPRATADCQRGGRARAKSGSRLRGSRLQAAAGKRGCARLSLALIPLLSARNGPYNGCRHAYGTWVPDSVMVRVRHGALARAFTCDEAPNWAMRDSRAGRMRPLDARFYLRSIDAYRYSRIIPSLRSTIASLSSVMSSPRSFNTHSNVCPKVSPLFSNHSPRLRT